MHSTLVLSRTGFALAAVVLMAGCGGGSSTSAASSKTTASSSSAAASSAPLAATPFCQESAATLGTLAPAFTSGGSDPTKLGPMMQQAAARVRAIQPPAALAADWKAFADGLDQFASSYSGMDMHDPAAASSFAARTGPLLASLGVAAGHVEAYLAANCGITAPTTLPGAPSS